MQTSTVGHASTLGQLIGSQSASWRLSWQRGTDTQHTPLLTPKKCYLSISKPKTTKRNIYKNYSNLNFGIDIDGSEVWGVKILKGDRVGRNLARGYGRKCSCERSGGVMSGRFNRDPPSSASSDRLVFEEREQHALVYVMRGISSRFGQ